MKKTKNFDLQYTQIYSNLLQKSCRYFLLNETISDGYKKECLFILYPLVYAGVVHFFLFVLLQHRTMAIIFWSKVIKEKKK